MTGVVAAIIDLDRPGHYIHWYVGRAAMVRNVGIRNRLCASWRQHPPHPPGVEAPERGPQAASGYAGDPGVLVRRSTDPRGVPDRRRREARRGRCTLLQRRKRHRRFR